jgi:hypothetical protein
MVQVEVMEHNCFMFLSVKFQTIAFNDLNLVFAASLICTDLKVSCVLVPFDCSTDLRPLSPNGKFGV